MKARFRIFPNRPEQPVAVVLIPDTDEERALLQACFKDDTIPVRQIPARQADGTLEEVALEGAPA